MNRTLLVLLVATALVWGCDFSGGGGGGVGGGTGGGGGVSLTFSKGFTWVRKDDRNVYLADDADLQTTAVLTQGGTAHTPSLSKNGKRIVFVSGSGNEAEIDTVAVAGGATSAVLTSQALAKNFRNPVFSPDGTRVAFTYDDASASSSIGLVNVDGSGFVKLIGGGALSYAMPTFSADGTSVLAAAGNSTTQLTQIERVTVSSGSAVNVTNTLGNEALTIANRVAVSPDGALAVFDGRVSSGVTRLFVIDLSSKVVTKVNDYMGEPNTSDSFPAWIDAATVSFSSDSGGNDNVYKVSTTGTGRKLLVPKAIEAWYGP